MNLKKIWFTVTVCISFIFLFASYIPNFYEVSISDQLPSDRVMTPAEHIYTYDYNVYLSKIRQGMESRWNVVDKYDNNPNQRGVFIQMSYLISGKFGGLLNLSSGLSFHLLRTVLSVFWIFTIIYLNYYFLKKPKWALIGVLLSLFAASWPVFYTYQGTTWIGMHMSWWQELDVLKRISYIPHYTLNYIIISVLTILFASQRKNFGLICLILFFSFFIHPSAGLLFLISWVIYHVIRFIHHPPSTIHLLPKIILQTIIIFTIALIPLLYFKYVTSTYPWKSLTDFDRLYRYPVDVKEYILALGPVFFTGIFGVILVLFKKNQKLLPLVTWIVGAFLAIFAFKKFPLQSELRFVQTANHIPLAILSIYFLEQLSESINKFLLGGEKRRVPASAQNSSSFFWFEHLREGISSQNLAKFIKISVSTLITGPIIVIGIAQSFFSIKAQTDFIHQRVVATLPLVPYPSQVMYPLKDMFDSFIWLEKNSKNEDIVLSHIYAGNYIPAYSGNFVYLGHNPETPHYDERVKKLELFYSGTMTDSDAEGFLKEENIRYVLYGPQEKEKSVEDIKKYKFLEGKFISSYITIYQVK